MKVKGPRFDPIIEVESDNLCIPEVRQWSMDKLKYFGHYASIFTNSMKERWDKLVYIDLFSGSGICKIKETGKTILGSPLIAMELPIKFDKYIFCEKDEERLEALKNRSRSRYNNLDISYILGDCNENIEKIMDALPRFSKKNKILSFCFIDPFSLNIKFNTIQKMSKYLVDILLNLSEISSIRNEHNYIKDNSSVIADLIGENNWYQNYSKSNESLSLFIFNSLNNKFNSIQYLEPENFPQIRSNVKNLPLYHLIFYSRHPLGKKFWNDIQKYSNSQPSLGF
ncbi:MAG: hypothetical protein HW421_3304 [Ignavibacteria bacterium]|nr:hypothetical protein [Ignavibacteria bacterium]